MTTTQSIPRPSRPSLGSNETAPPSQLTKTRRSLPASSLPQSRPSSSSSNAAYRSFQSSRIASASANYSPLSPSDSNSPGLLPEANAVKLTKRSVRKITSIPQFPPPPTGVSRSIPVSPQNETGINGIAGPRGSHDEGPATPGTIRKPAKRAASGAVRYSSNNNTPSLLNGSGQGKTIISENPPDAAGLPSPTSADLSTAATPISATEDDRSREGPRESKGNVVVSVRVRPNSEGGDPDATGEWLVDGRRSLVSHRGKEGGEYYFDNVFSMKDQNDRVYDAAAKRLVRRVMEGYHGTIFAYGQTGSGKTYTMSGTRDSLGLIPMAITDLFAFIRQNPNREFLLRVSYLEIYNEKIHDLLAPPVEQGIGPAQQEEIKLREGPRGVYATPLKEEIVQSPNQLLRVIARGDQCRRTGSTQFNARSSRSHAVVQIVVESRQRAGSGKREGLVPGGVRVSTLSLIDLAGSERAAENKERRTEGSHINKSLLTLGNVVASLSGKKDKDGHPMDRDGKHLPYRDSKLTRLLQPALSGGSLVSILCTIQIGSTGAAAAGLSHNAESLNTLKFAARAKNNIVSHAKKAEEAFGKDPGILLERYLQEITDLKAQLAAKPAGVTVLPGVSTEVQEDIAREKELEKEAAARHEEMQVEMQLAKTALRERIEHLNRLILSSQSSGVNHTNGALSALGVHPRGSSMNLNGHMSTVSTKMSNASLRNGKTISIASNSTLGPLPFSDHQHQFESDDETGEYADGHASLQAQVRALQVDLNEKSRYIKTLERRLQQARRSSTSRASMALAPNRGIGLMHGNNDEMSVLLAEKDRELTECKRTIDDKDKIISALKSASSRRDRADLVDSTKGMRKSVTGLNHSRKTSSRESNGAVGRMGPVVPTAAALRRSRNGSRTVESPPGLSLNSSNASPKGRERGLSLLDQLLSEQGMRGRGLSNRAPRRSQGVESLRDSILMPSPGDHLTSPLRTGSTDVISPIDIHGKLGGQAPDADQEMSPSNPLRQEWGTAHDEPSPAAPFPGRTNGVGALYDFHEIPPAELKHSMTAPLPSLIESN